MNEFVVQIAIKVPAQDKARAEEKLREFFSCVYVDGKPVYFDVLNVQAIVPLEVDNK